MDKRTFLKNTAILVGAGISSELVFAQSKNAEKGNAAGVVTTSNVSKSVLEEGAVIKLGQSAPFTGLAKDLGIEMRDGALSYFKTVNDLGGVNGHIIELVSLDDQYEPEKTKVNTEKFVKDGVFALFGYVGTPTSVAARPLFEAEKIPFIAPVTGAESLRNPVSPYIFNVRSSYLDETERIVEHITSFGIEKIAVFYQNDGYGQAGLAGVKRAMEARKLKITIEATVERNSLNVSDAIKKIGDINPEAIILISAYGSCAQFIKEYKKTGKISQFYNVSFVGSKSLADALGDDGYGVIISQVVPAPTDLAIPVVSEFNKVMNAYDKKLPKTFGRLEGFLAAKLLVEVIRKLPSKTSREELIRELNNVNKLDLGGFIVTFSETSHSGSRFVDLTMIGKSKNFVY